MVQSIINKDIIYDEKKDVHSNDINYENSGMVYFNIHAIMKAHLHYY